MKQKQIKILISIFLLMFFLNGCIGVDRSFRQIRNYILENTDTEYSREVEFSIGSAGISVASIMVRMADVEEPIDEILSEISKAKSALEKMSEKIQSLMTGSFINLKSIS